MNSVAQRWHIGGRVQGVGFRPFVYRLACSHQLTGWVRNTSGLVEIHAEGPAGRMAAFGDALFLASPATARARLIDTTSAKLESSIGFQILTSRSDAQSHASLPIDLFTCDDCLNELRDPAARRYRYPFINCTACGPRYTVIRDLPYDRPNTSLAGFLLCADCEKEYGNPLDRRFHAQPLACAVCGPELTFENAGRRVVGNEDALRAAVSLLRDGRILAMRGVGGYHLLCDAASDEAVQLLRVRKGRPVQPFAIMMPWQGTDGLDAVRRVALLTAVEAQALTDAVRPIVIALRCASASVSLGIAPDLRDLGVMLPYSPLHHLLTDDFGGALVATSGNLSGEPVLTDPNDARDRLRGIADGFLHHNRPILRPADDPVVRFSGQALRPLRLGRGSAPLEMTLPHAMRVPTLAVGAYSKATVTLAWDNRAIVSPHVGDLSSPRGRAVLLQVAEDLQRLYGVRAARIVHDAHPHFPTTRWARESGLPCSAVWHHDAHAAAVAGEYPNPAPLLCFTWDGVGLGPDGSLWGGEALLGEPGRWQRVASFRPFRLPGGERASRQPWRSAVALCWESGYPWEAGDVQARAPLRAAFDHGVNSPPTTSVGRLFDAAAALIGICATSTYEGEAGMRLEAMSETDVEAIALPLAPDGEGLWRTDWAPLIPVLLDGRRTPGERSAVFHATLAQAACAQAIAIRLQVGVNHVGLSGGVFQNRVLLERTCCLLTGAGFTVVVPELLPLNDAAISFGQSVQAAAMYA